MRRPWPTGGCCTKIKQRKNSRVRNEEIIRNKNYEEGTIEEIKEMKLFKYFAHLTLVKMYGQMNITWFSAGNRKMQQKQEH
jgi:hypothetical protein